MQKNVVAVILARGGSKRIPKKNLLPLDGKPLIVHTIERAKQSRLVQRVIVSTDDREIAAVPRQAGAQIIDRPPALAGDAATSASALLHALDRIEEEGSSPDLIVLLQCTSPIRRSEDIDRAIQTILEENADSLFSAAASRACIWQEEPQGLRPLTYDPARRQREQEWPRQWRENGSIYVSTPQLIRRQAGNWLGGAIAVYEMDWWSSFQIDASEDVILCEWILQRRHERAVAVG